MEWLNTILALLRVGPEVKKWIDVGLPIIDELGKEDSKLIPVFEKIGKELFPSLSDQIAIVAAAADALFDPHGTMWVQRSLNLLQDSGLAVDGQYGSRTKAAVTAYQTANQPAAGPIDGWAGPVTCRVIEAEMEKRGIV